MVVDALAAHLDFEPFKTGTLAAVAEGRAFGLDMMVVKPLTFMNLSGEVVRRLANIEGFKLERDLIVVVDDVALPVGSMRIRASGSSGGHNGLDNVSDELGTENFARLRVGVGPKIEVDCDLATFVLQEFEASEADALAELIPTALNAIECWMTEGVDEAMNRFNRKVPE